MENRSGRTEAFVGEGVFPAHLRIGELIRLQEKLNVGPQRLAERLTGGDYFVQDIQETIRWGLVGAGMSHMDAHRLIESFVTDGHIEEYRVVAQSIIMAALFGSAFEEEDLEDEEPQEGNSQTPTSE